MALPESVDYLVAQNEDTGACCLMIPDRAGRGTPARARLLAGGLYWTAADGLAKQLGSGEPLPPELLAQIQLGQELVVLPITASGLPSTEFVLTIV